MKTKQIFLLSRIAVNYGKRNLPTFNLNFPFTFIEINNFMKIKCNSHQKKRMFKLYLSCDDLFASSDDIDANEEFNATPVKASLVVGTTNNILNLN